MSVKRINVGGALAQVAWAAVLKAAEEMKTGAVNALLSNVSATQLIICSPDSREIGKQFQAVRP